MRYILSIIIGIAIFGCNNFTKEGPLAFVPPIFPEEIEIVPSYFEANMVAMSAFRLYLKDTVLLARAYDGERLIQILNKKSGEKISAILPYGRGPGEMTSSPDLFVLEDSIYAYSITDSKLYKYYSIRDYTGIMPNDIINFNNRLLSWVRPFKNKYLAGTNARNNRFIIYDVNGNEEFLYTKYPDFDDIGYNDSLTVRNIFLGGTDVGVKPDGTKFAIVLSHGAMLEIFSISENTISLHKEKRFYPPKMEITDGSLKSVQALPSQIRGFYDIKTTDEYIYALFDGTRLDGEFIPPSYIYVFDWDGNPVRSYKVKGGLMRFALDAENKMIYCTTMDMETKEEPLGYFSILE